MRRVVLDPVTRIEGHALLEICFGPDAGVTARLVGTELRGFEKLCVGRPVEEMPRLTSRICGMCPAAHHVAAARAADAVFEVDPPPPAHRLRELALCLQMAQSHLTHFYLLGLPDLIGCTGPDGQPSLRIMEEELGPDTCRYVLEQRSYPGKILALLGGKGIHPEFAVPGGVTTSLSAEKTYQIQAMLRSLLSFALFTLAVFRDKVLARARLDRSAPAGETYHLARLANGSPSLYEGDLVVAGPEGTPVELLAEGECAKRLVGGRSEGNCAEAFSFRSREGHLLPVQVGPLARANAATRFSTPEAEAAYREMLDTLGPKPLQGEIAHYWARLVEVVYVTERALELTDGQHGGEGRRLPLPAAREGCGLAAVEAPRGLLLHEYAVDDAGLLQRVRIVTPTAINLRAVDEAATAAARQALGTGGEREAVWAAEKAVRAFDPCLSCATHVVRVGPTSARGGGRC